MSWCGCRVEGQRALRCGWTGRASSDPSHAARCAWWCAGAMPDSSIHNCMASSALRARVCKGGNARAADCAKGVLGQYRQVSGSASWLQYPAHTPGTCRPGTSGSTSQWERRVGDGNTVHGQGQRAHGTHVGGGPMALAVTSVARYLPCAHDMLVLCVAVACKGDAFVADEWTSTTVT